MYPGQLVHLVTSREQRLQPGTEEHAEDVPQVEISWGLREHLVEHTARSPDVHLEPIEPRREQTLWRAVPPGGNVLSVGRPAVDASDRPQVRDLYDLVLEWRRLFQRDLD